MRARRHHGSNGFTLVELLVVVSILGALAGVVVFAASAATAAAQRSACLAEGAALRTAVEVFRQQVGFYPTNDSQLAPYELTPAKLVTVTFPGGVPTYSWNTTTGTACSAITPAITP